MYQIEPPNKMEYYGCTPFVTNPYVVIELVTECHDWSYSVTCFYILTSPISLIEVAQLGPVLKLGLLIFHHRT